MDYNLSAEDDKDITLGAFSSRFLKAQPLWNVTAESGKKTLVMHWPGGSFPPTSDSENLITIDGSSPGACCAWSSVRDLDMLYVASTKATKPSYMPLSIVTTDVEGDEDLKFVLPPTSGNGTSSEAKEKLKHYQQWYKEFINVDGYQPDKSFVVDNIVKDPKGLMWCLADFPTGCTISPIAPAHDWEFEIPADAKEFMIITFYGKVMRQALILKNDEGIYDRVALYKSKKNTEPLVVLPLGKMVAEVIDEAIKNDKTYKVNRNMKLLKLDPEAKHLTMYISAAMDMENDTCYHPKRLFREICDNVGSYLAFGQTGFAFDYRVYAG